MSVFNEEKRIEAVLRSVVWCDEIVILDKQSTDRTREIARQYTDKIIEVPWQEFRTEEIRITMDHVTSEWVIGVTASDVMHPRLAGQIRALTDRDDFPYDVIHIPFRRYVLGLETPYSPWYSELAPCVFRKRVLRVRGDSVHGAVHLDTDRHYYLPNSAEYCVYHLTHETMDMMMDRHIRYWQAEAQTFPQEKPLRKAFNPILRSAFDVMIRRKTWLMGWDGLALIMAFMSYWLLRFVYIWESRRSHATETYDQIRQNMVKAWQEN
jgi:glycosyltransferase involved in cell wall biosynthesis